MTPNGTTGPQNKERGVGRATEVSGWTATEGGGNAADVTRARALAHEQGRPGPPPAGRLAGCVIDGAECRLTDRKLVGREVAEGRRRRITGVSSGGPGRDKAGGGARALCRRGRRGDLGDD